MKINSNFINFLRNTEYYFRSFAKEMKENDISGVIITITKDSIEVIDGNKNKVSYKFEEDEE